MIKSLSSLRDEQIPKFLTVVKPTGDACLLDYGISMMPLEYAIILRDEFT